jgi:hypothetical protein
LFPGGAQRAAAEMKTPVSVRPSSRQAGAVQRGVEEIAAAVAGKHPAGAVGAVGAGRQADDPQPRPRVAEPRNRAAPVGLIGVRLPFHVGDRQAVGPQPVAGVASGDVAIKDGKGCIFHQIPAD